jgi:transcriptional regulator with XRE-family HTH domain
MNDLSVKIRKLRGKLSQREMAEKCGVSLKTIVNLEHGDSVKLNTLNDIANSQNIKNDTWLELVAAWIKNTIGEDATRILIEPKYQNESLHDKDSEVMQLNFLIRDLHAEDRNQLLLLLKRPEIRRVIPALNKLYDVLLKQ